MRLLCALCLLATIGCDAPQTDELQKLQKEYLEANRKVDDAADDLRLAELEYGENSPEHKMADKAHWDALDQAVRVENLLNIARYRAKRIASGRPSTVPPKPREPQTAQPAAPNTPADTATGPTSQDARKFLEEQLAQVAEIWTATDDAENLALAAVREQYANDAQFKAKENDVLAQYEPSKKRLMDQRDMLQKRLDALPTK
jgi:hypothetical protein